MKNPTRSTNAKAKLTTLFMVTFLSLLYILYTFNYISHANSCIHNPLNPTTPTITTTKHKFLLPRNPNHDETDTNHKTQIHQIVFGIAASKNLWDHRKEYIKLWWRPNVTRGYVWFDQLPDENDNEDDIYTLPPYKISGDTSEFKYTNNEGDPSSIRISRIVSETVRLGLDDVRWFVMGDDDTVFVVENLIRVLDKYDHNGYYYIGSSSESHLQNIRFSYNMAYGGGGFAISYPLAKELEKIQDRCLERHPGLYGSDDRIQACMAELGVPLTKEIGFHQFDMNGNVFGYLAAHPTAPLVSLHHLDKIEPLLPQVNQIQALKQLTVPMNLDPGALMQQSICHHRGLNWTVSVSWGYAVQILRGIIPHREMEKPEQTFLDWYPEAWTVGFPFNTRPLGRDGCTMSYIYTLSNAQHLYFADNQTVSDYAPLLGQDDQVCDWKMADPALIDRVRVYKRPNPRFWDKGPRRNCCRFAEFGKKGNWSLEINVGECSHFDH